MAPRKIGRSTDVPDQPEAVDVTEAEAIERQCRRRYGGAGDSDRYATAGAGRAARSGPRGDAADADDACSGREDTSTGTVD